MSPQALHLKRTHHNFPLCSETATIKYKDLSPASKRLLKAKLGDKVARKYVSCKLISSFRPKKRYILHYMTLKQALNEGLRLKRVRRAVGFVQERFAEKFLKKVIIFFFLKFIS